MTNRELIEYMQVCNKSTSLAELIWSHNITRILDSNVSIKEYLDLAEDIQKTYMYVNINMLVNIFDKCNDSNRKDILDEVVKIIGCYENHLSRERDLETKQGCCII